MYGIKHFPLVIYARTRSIVERQRQEPLQQIQHIAATIPAPKGFFEFPFDPFSNGYSRQHFHPGFNIPACRGWRLAKNDGRGSYNQRVLLNENFQLDVVKFVLHGCRQGNMTVLLLEYPMGNVSMEILHGIQFRHNFLV